MDRRFFFRVVREKRLELSRLWLDTGTSSLPVYLFQHSRISRRESYYNRILQFVNRFFRFSDTLSMTAQTDGFQAFSVSPISTSSPSQLKRAFSPAPWVMRCI